MQTVHRSERRTCQSETAGSDHGPAPGECSAEAALNVASQGTSTTGCPCLIGCAAIMPQPLQKTYTRMQNGADMCTSGVTALQELVVALVVRHCRLAQTD